MNFQNTICEFKCHYLLQMSAPNGFELLKMILSLSSITDQEKYNDVIASVQNWHDLYIHAFVNILAERTHGEPRSHENKSVRDA